MDIRSRVQKLVSLLDQRGLTQFVAAPGATFRYLTGSAIHLSERLTLCGVSQDGAVALLVPELEVPGLPAGHAKSRVLSYSDDAGPAAAFDEFARLLGISRASAVGYEEMALRQFEYRSVARLGCGMDAVDDMTAQLRMYKEPDEVEAIRRAAGMVDRALDLTLPLLKVGMSELEIAAELEYRLRQLGSQGLPFATIVGSGPRGALPHGAPSDKRTAPGELIVLDYGAVVDGYAADITRTLAFADPDAEAIRAYEIVRRAQSEGVAMCRPGVTFGEIDRAVREVIEREGFGAHFTHRTGHGLGLEPHEPPSVVAGNVLTVREGMVFTVEPGVYLPDRYGVRIEDDVAIAGDGAEVLTRFPRDMIVL